MKSIINMKTPFICTILLVSLCIASVGCKKLANGSGSGDGGNNGGNNGGTVGKYTNPNTTSVICDYDVSDTAYTNHGWTKTFEDDFTGDLSKWNLIKGGLIMEEQCYEPANVQIAGGAVQIAAKKETVSGPKTVGNDTMQNFNYTSGWMVSKSTFVANSSTPKVRIVARIKMASGYGLTSLFYGFGGGAWPTTGEIDFAETQGDNTKVYATDYAYGSSANSNVVSGGILYNPVTEDLSSCYHLYVMEWTQNSLNSYIDGKLVETKTKGGYVSSLFGKPQYLTFSLPIGGLYYSQLKTANIQGGTMSIDYVKVFTSN
ncbi:glycoside hydrolase family 16 protein [Mucilaginibacter ginsenosidivorans]|uniref:Glycoside hydrolase family 16 protein n=1 Tax=Mucilaginibacter ginsenosidivorans TaxID=398053 RepID=A0A5B8UYQ2_9SPHI|nr:glycoside hydrolase family 16 protein [Mucilaginibacter ginsenosidivorans]QEC63516.1 glycoside hydrolase family 16 protein [Mucilaginibacter ginsenosidivorans]